ncbi:hypothetical protein D6774_02035 [Candidatus Woesearchaeota archaeon]|nr:MAG: hypothetical protein D6774_02035 [Candidatus Woesearchaeota archaeon]
MFPRLRSGQDITVQYSGKTVIGLIERVTLKGPSGKKKTVLARIDTGATKSSVDIRLAADLELGPILRSTTVKSASGTGVRPIVQAHINIKGKQLSNGFTLADRSHMKYPVLIGQDILINDFLIDPAKEAD